MVGSDRHGRDGLDEPMSFLLARLHPASRRSTSRSDLLHPHDRRSSLVQAGRPDERRGSHERIHYVPRMRGGTSRSVLCSVWSTRRGDCRGRTGVATRSRAGPGCRRAPASCPERCVVALGNGAESGHGLVDTNDSTATRAGSSREPTVERAWSRSAATSRGSPAWQCVRRTTRVFPSRVCTTSPRRNRHITRRRRSVRGTSQEEAVALDRRRDRRRDHHRGGRVRRERRQEHVRSVGHDDFGHATIGHRSDVGSRHDRSGDNRRADDPCTDHGTAANDPAPSDSAARTAASGTLSAVVPRHERLLASRADRPTLLGVR